MTLSLSFFLLVRACVCVWSQLSLGFQRPPVWHQRVQRALCGARLRQTALRPHRLYHWSTPGGHYLCGGALHHQVSHALTDTHTHAHTHIHTYKPSLLMSPRAVFSMLSVFGKSQGWVWCSWAWRKQLKGHLAFAPQRQSTVTFPVGTDTHIDDNRAACVYKPRYTVMSV